MGWEGKERGEVMAGLAVVGGKRCTVSPGHCEVVVAGELLCCVCVSCSFLCCLDVVYCLMGRRLLSLVVVLYYEL